MNSTGHWHARLYFSVSCMMFWSAILHRRCSCRFILCSLHSLLHSIHFSSGGVRTCLCSRANTFLFLKRNPLLRLPSLVPHSFRILLSHLTDSPLVSSPLVPGALTAGPLVSSPLVPGPLTAGPLVSSPLVPGPLTAGPLVSSPLVPCARAPLRKRGDGSRL